MHEIEGTAATTHRDSHGERLSRKAIAQLAEHFNAKCIPMWLQHDPRVPPVGRYTKAEVRPLPDGEYAVITHGEAWDYGEQVPFLSDREMPLGRPEDDQPFVRFDRGMSDTLCRQEIADIAKVMGAEPRQDVKKAADPVTILTLGGMFVVGAIATGFLNKLGSDLYDVVVPRIKSIFARKREGGSSDKNADALLRFQVFVLDRGDPCLIDIIITNPLPEDIDYLFGDGLRALDGLIPALLKDRRSIRRIVIELEGRELIVKFGVRSDCVPVFPDRAESRG